MNPHLFMQRALELASLGRGNVSPNPMVGCVIVYENTIIGEGYHQKAGGPHAEVWAVESVKTPELLPESTVYVTLEPCAHHGKTPPCADMLVRLGVKKVVVGAVDTNPLVGGKGIRKLQDAGIEVETGVMETECRDLNKRFFTYMEAHRPYIVLKWAQTSDGFIARENFDSKWISSPQARQLVHQWRAHEDAVLVGKNTALHDNPLLTVRDWHGKNPLRLVIDRNLHLPAHLHLFDGSLPTLCYNTKLSRDDENLHYIQLTTEGFMHQMMADLHHRKVQSVLVEGGSVVLNELIRHNLWDEARVFVAPQPFGSGIIAPTLSAFLPQEELSIGPDRLLIYQNQGISLPA
jgi:diaminohydroxyphosphoribosylaminopyrimidine deaminase / 5-amino-6-(5-phosphoribosylamino)uracil reductase